MTLRIPTMIVLIMVFLPVIARSAGPRGGDAYCREMSRLLKLKRSQLAEYMGAFRQLHDKGDLRLMELFNHKISGLLNDIRKIEKDSPCPGLTENGQLDGISPARTDTGLYADKTCRELKLLRIQLLLKIESLRRREKAIFSRLNPEEREDLDRGRSDLEDLKTALGERCPHRAGSRRSAPGAEKRRYTFPLRR